MRDFLKHLCAFAADVRHLARSFDLRGVRIVIEVEGRHAATIMSCEMANNLAKDGSLQEVVDILHPRSHVSEVYGIPFEIRDIFEPVTSAPVDLRALHPLAD